MELHTLDLEHHDFSALTKVFIIDFDNVNSSRDVIHALVASCNKISRDLTGL